MDRKESVAKLKMSYPSLRQPARVTFGKGSIKELATADALQDTVFFISARNEVLAAVDATFQKQGLALNLLRTLPKPPGEPSLEMIDLGARFLGNRAPRRIIRIGGGSVMDWCRLSWAQQQGVLSTASGNMAPPIRDEARTRFWLVPTTCATGAEAAAVAVYSSGGRKVAVISDAFIAEHAVLDSQFLEQMPHEHIATSLADTLSHAIESYCSIVQNTLAKEAAVSALWLVLEHGSSPSNPCRRDRLMEAGYLAGLAASHCSVGVVHAFAHTISRYGFSHAHANAIGLRAGIALNADAAPLQSLAKRVGLSGCEGLVEALTPIMTSAVTGRDHHGLVQVLSDEQHRHDIVAAMRADVCLRTNPVPLDEHQLNGFLDRVVEAIGQP
jgi:alcohol dehydrogenase